MKRLMLLSFILSFTILGFSQSFTCGGFEYETKSVEGSRIEIYVRGHFGGAALLPHENLHNMVDISLVSAAHVGGASAGDGSALPDGRDEEVWVFEITGSNPSFSAKTCSGSLSFADAKIDCGGVQMELKSVSGNDAEVIARVEYQLAYITPTNYLVGMEDAQLGGSGNPNHYGLGGAGGERGELAERVWPITITGSNPKIYFKRCPDAKISLE